MKAFQAYFVAALFLTATAAICSAAPIIPAPEYGPPPGAYRYSQQSRTFAPFRAVPPAPTAFEHALSPPPPAPAPSWSYYQRNAQPFQRDTPQSYFRQPPQQQQQFQRQLLHPQQLQQLQQPQQQFRTELQGVWKYTVPVRPRPLREDEVPHQGLGATDSVTMPEAAPFDPLLVTGPAAAHFVRALSDREPHFYPAFPHTRLVLGNQQKRLDNGLPANRLGSIRTSSDFLRYD